MATSRTLEILITAKNNATKQLDTLNKKVKDMQPAFQKMAVAGGVGLAAISAGVGLAVKNASDLEESINAVNVVFGDGAKKILDFGKTANTSVGMANSAFNQMSTQTGALLKDTGLSMDEVASKTIQLSTRAADMASVFNTDVSDAMSAINQALRGETEAIRRYAGDVTDATLETFRLSQGINKSVTEMTQQEKRLLRIDLLMSQTEVTTGDFANTADSLANKQRILAATLTNISTLLGNTFIPIVQQVLNTIEPVIQSTAKWIEENPTLARNILIAAAALSALILALGTLGLLLPGIITAFTILFSPITLATAAISALILITIKLASEWSQTKDSLVFVWDIIKETFSSSIDYITNKLSFLIGMIDKVKSLGSTISKSFINLPANLGFGGARASGGPVSGGSSYLVGEKGPEIFSPSTSGKIIPNNSIGGGGINITVNGDVSGNELIEKVKQALVGQLSLNNRIAI